MTGVRSIETLSLFFTAGVVAGSVLSGGSLWAVCILVLPFSTLAYFFGAKLLKAGQAVLNAVFPLTFLLLGLFCAANAALIPGTFGSGLSEMASGGASALRRLIGEVPFRGHDTAPLLSALLTGDRSGLSHELTGVFRKSGASHLLALSGLHIGIIYLILTKLTSVLGRSPASRHIRFWLITAAAGYFTFMTGASPSIVRAFLFILINEILRLTGRPRKASRVLCLALLVQLVLEPEVISSLGFQLSYLAMGGILLVYPVMEEWYPEGPKSIMRGIWKSAALTISCQVFTAPLVWFRFHVFPKYFLLTNLLALPLTTVLMTSSVITLALSAAGMCPDILVRGTDYVCGLLIRVLETVSSLP